MFGKGFEITSMGFPEAVHPLESVISKLYVPLDTIIEEEVEPLLQLYI